ncbi:DsbA family oxidoreductase [Simiduia curdlanivorans]|uniref:DsbA family oxidoreductase n=1 Tax=Simiduia curdlanivorans TaxID=1492769 RepID=A0ABV8UZ56_9GAMM|nr:DsbA family oxidoreductase [Simiduia curdlanivorans]MDN3640344.1 DsbA family oxidoreductase [Simiduia curdlanivorans]
MVIDISVWSDIACPWCFVGKQRLAVAVDQLKAEGIEVDIRWRAFELDPRPKEKDGAPYVERLAKKYGRSIAQAQEMLDTMAAAIQTAGGPCDFSRVQIANTFNAHRLIQWAGATDRAGETDGAQHRLTDGLMRGYLGEGLDLSSAQAMVDLVDSLGLDAPRAAGVLSSDDFADAVRQDEQLAQQYGISGVPFFVIGRYGVSGAQESSTLMQAIRDVHREAAEQEANKSRSLVSDAPACDVDGCD